MKRLAGIVLYVQNPESLAHFYMEHLGMSVRQDGAEFQVGYDGPDADLILRPSTNSAPYVHSRDDRYWKIGITLPNVDLACEQLTQAGVMVNTPKQFRDIGYLTHLTDPEGFQIELLQHTFQDQPRSTTGLWAEVQQLVR